MADSAAHRVRFDGPPLIDWLIGLAGLALLAFASTGGQLQTVVGRAWPLPWGLGAVPWWTVGVLLPVVALVLAGWGCWRAGLARPAGLRGLTLAATLLALAGTLAIWAVHLPRHDRALTALHAATVLMLLAWALPGWRARGVGLAVAAAALATLSYGAIWGETRCQEPGPVRCLAEQGPRVWVPQWLGVIGVPVFVALPGADLRGVDLSGRDLRLADLRGAQLDGALLRQANLRRAWLDGVRAPGSSWPRAYVDGASLRGAQLAGADWRQVHAFNVDLRDADLRAADARGASLSHAQLDRALLDGLQVQGSYLRFATGWADTQLRQMQRDAATRLPDGAAIAPP